MTTELTKEEKIEQLVEYIVETMGMSALKSLAKENLTEYYGSDNGENDLENNYLEMKDKMLELFERKRIKQHRLRGT